MLNFGNLVPELPGRTKAFARVMNTPHWVRNPGTDGRDRVTDPIHSTRGAGILAQLIRGV